MGEILWSVLLISVLFGAFFVPVGYYIFKRFRDIQNIKKLPPQERVVIEEKRINRVSKEMDFFASLLLLSAFGLFGATLHQEVELPVKLGLIAVSCIVSYIAYRVKKK